MREPPQDTNPSAVRRVGIVGAGLMGRWHAHAVRAIGGQVVGVADPQAERSRKIATDAGARAYASAAEMLAGERPDVLHICTTTPTHGALIREAFEHGADAFVEKPLSATRDETQTLCALAQDTGRALCPVHQYAFQRSVETILAQRARLGTLTHVDLRFFSAGGDMFAPAEHPQIAADILPHPLSILQRLFPDQSLTELNWDIAGSDAAGWEMTARAGDVFLRISISLQARPTVAGLTLWGTRGSFVADLFHDYLQFRPGTVSRRAKMLRPFADSLGQFTRASTNIAGRLVRREPAYPGLRTLTRRFHAACAGQDARPIPTDDIIAVADLRDRFLAHVLPGAAGGAEQ